MLTKNILLVLILTTEAAHICAKLETQNLPPPKLSSLKKLLSNGYETDRPSAWAKNESVEVYMSLYIESISNFRATDMSFTVDMYITEDWYDDRLKHSELRGISVSDNGIINQIWTPDIFFANAKETHFHEVTKPNNNVQIYSNGHVSYAFRVSGTFSCKLTLQMYPNDVQECFIRMLSYSYPIQEMHVKWREKDPFLMNPDVTLPEMEITKLKPLAFNRSYSVTGEDIATLDYWTFSCLKASISVKRRIGYHMVQTYIPSSTIVAISWVSFWIDPYAVPARVALSITTFLTLTTQSAGVHISLPRVSYAKAIDYWMGICLVMILAALLEFTLVTSYLQLARRCKSTKTERQSDCNGKRRRHSQHNDADTRMEPAAADHYVKIAHRIEKCSKIAFPLTFTIISVIYWVVILTA